MFAAGSAAGGEPPPSAPADVIPMLIECPACHTRSQLPADKEGAKVRCGECGRVYVARDAFGRSGSVQGNDGTRGIMIAIVAGVIGLVIVFVYTQSGDAPADTVVAQADTKPKVAPVEIDPRGWRSEVVQTAVQVHEAAFQGQREKLIERIDGAGLFAWERARAEAAGETREGAATFGELSPGDQHIEVERLAAELTESPAMELVHAWKPFDGEVSGDDPSTAAGSTVRVRLAVTPRDGGSAERRSVDWHMLRSGGTWKIQGYERHFSEAELEELARAARRNVDRGFKEVELSDGSIVREREPEPLPHLESTPPELRARIDELFATMVDLEQTRAGPAAQRDLIAIGKPALPVLLTGLYEIPLETEEQGIQLNLIVHALRDISGVQFGFRPMLLEGSAFGTTEERRESAIKQWFAWWYLEGEKFEARPEEPDLLEQMLREDEDS